MRGAGARVDGSTPHPPAPSPTRGEGELGADKDGIARPRLPQGERGSWARTKTKSPAPSPTGERGSWARTKTKSPAPSPTRGEGKLGADKDEKPGPVSHKGRGGVGRGQRRKSPAPSPTRGEGELGADKDEKPGPVSHKGRGEVGRCDAQDILFGRRASQGQTLHRTAAGDFASFWRTSNLSIVRLISPFAHPQVALDARLNPPWSQARFALIRPVSARNHPRRPLDSRSNLPRFPQGAAAGRGNVGFMSDGKLFSDIKPVFVSGRRGCEIVKAQSVSMIAGSAARVVYKCSRFWQSQSKLVA